MKRDDDKTREAPIKRRDRRGGEGESRARAGQRAPIDRGDTRRKGNRAPSKPAETTMRIGKSLKMGGSYVVRVSRKAYKDFNSYTQTGELPGAQKRKRRGPSTPVSRNMTYVLFLATIFLITAVALMVLNNSSVNVEKKTVSVVGLPSDLEGYNILVVSDLHGRSFGTKQTSLLRTINGLSYNLVLFAGDMVGASGNAQPFYDLLEGMTANRKTYFIPGDSDPPVLLDAARGDSGALDQLVLSDWVLGAQERGAVYLSATTGVKVGQSTLWLSPADQLSLDIQAAKALFEEETKAQTEGAVYGIDVDRATLPFTEYRYRQILKLDENVRLMQTGDTHIALSHIPPTSDYISVTQSLYTGNVEEYNYLPMVDLVLSGHYCGGGWKLPFIGALYVPDTLLKWHGWFPAQSTVQGLRALGSTQIYTSPGLSVTDKIYLPNFRLFNNPTVTVLTLTSAITDDLLGG